MLPVPVAIFGGTGLFVALLGLPLLLRRVGPNALYGLRTKATFADDTVWYDANAASARDLLVLGLGTALLSAVLGRVPGISEDMHLGVMATLLVVGAVVVARVGSVRAERMLSEREARDEPEARVP